MVSLPSPVQVPPSFHSIRTFSTVRTPSGTGPMWITQAVELEADVLGGDQGRVTGEAAELVRQLDVNRDPDAVRGHLDRDVGRDVEAEQVRLELADRELEQGRAGPQTGRSRSISPWKRTTSAPPPSASTRTWPIVSIVSVRGSRTNCEPGSGSMIRPFRVIEPPVTTSRESLPVPFRKQPSIGLDPELPRSRCSGR